jgi:hypothetical protein
VGEAGRNRRSDAFQVRSSPARKRDRLRGAVLRPWRNRLRGPKITGADIVDGSLGAADLSVAAAFGSENASNPLSHVDTVLSSATVNLARTSTLIVFGQSDGSATCVTPDTGENVCQVEVGLYLDGSPIPNSAGTGVGLFPNEFVRFDGTPMFGIVRNVAAGTHTVSVGVGTRSGDDVSVSFRGERVSAISIPE